MEINFFLFVLRKRDFDKLEPLQKHGKHLPAHNTCLYISKQAFLHITNPKPNKLYKNHVLRLISTEGIPRYRFEISYFFGKKLQNP